MHIAHTEFCTPDTVDSLFQAWMSEVVNSTAKRDQEHPNKVLIFKPDVSVPELTPVVVLGGMGPQAGLMAFDTVVRETQGKRVVVLVQACSVPDRSTALREGSDSVAYRAVVDAMGDAIHAASIHVARAHVIVSCNTAHAFLLDVWKCLPGTLQATFHVHSIVEAAAREAKALMDASAQPASCLLLATDGTRQTQLYHRTFASLGITEYAVDAESQALLMRAIYDGVKAGDLAQTQMYANALFERLLHNGAALPACVIAGCTEVPMVWAALLDAHPIKQRQLVDPVSCAVRTLIGHR